MQEADKRGGTEVEQKDRGQRLEAERCCKQHGSYLAKDLLGGGRAQLDQRIIKNNDGKEREKQTEIKTFCLGPFLPSHQLHPLQTSQQFERLDSED